MIAAQHGHAGVVEVLLARGADPNKARTDDGATPCFIAAREGHAGVVELLLARGADPNKACTDDGATPCWIAAATGHVEIVRLLIARGASLRAMLALHPDTPPALATYLNGAREWTPLHVAADARDVATLRALLRDARVDPRLAVRAVLPDMRTALSIAGSASYPMARAVDKRARELLREAAEGVTWTGAKHRLCAADVRKAARARALMLSGRGMPVLNDDVWGMIFSFLLDGRGPRCAEVDEAAFAAGIAAAGRGSLGRTI